MNPKQKPWAIRRGKERHITLPSLKKRSLPYMFNFNKPQQNKQNHENSRCSGSTFGILNVMGGTLHHLSAVPPSTAEVSAHQQRDPQGQLESSLANLEVSEPGGGEVTFNKSILRISHLRIVILYIYWMWHPHSNSHHQDYYIFSRESL